jgi:hypothetical protein
MNEWKELNIDNLPQDIFSEKSSYEVEELVFDMILPSKRYERGDYHDVLKLLMSGYRFRYRRKQKPAPTHEEILSRWWKTDKNNCWVKPVQYIDGFYGFANTTYPVPVINQPKEWFRGRESATIPPEE